MDFDFSHDSAFKNLIEDFPEDTIRWLFPESEEILGKILKIEPLREEMPKFWLSDPGRETDYPMRVNYESGPAIIALIEHKSSKDDFSIYKLAHYALDLAEAYPNEPILPIVIFADQKKWRKDVPREIELKALGQTWLYFKYKKVKVNDLNAADIANCDNPVLHILTPLMSYPKEERLQYISNAYLNLFRLTNRRKTQKFMDFIDKYADIKLEERDALIANLSEKKGTVMIREYLLEKGMEKGIAKGKEEAQINFAIKLIHEGFDETTIVRLTDLSLDQVRQLIRKHK